MGATLKELQRKLHPAADIRVGGVQGEGVLPELAVELDLYAGCVHRPVPREVYPPAIGQGPPAEALVGVALGGAL
jgi:hypothetical protein